MIHVLGEFLDRFGALLKDNPAVGIMVCISVGLLCGCVFKLGRLTVLTRKDR